jgi:hypothetical protein
MLVNEAASNSNDIFSIAVILKQVLSYVGPGHGLFIAEVSRWWQQIYKTIATVRVRAVPKNIVDCSSRFVRCRLLLTLGQAVFASQSRLRWAHAA